CVRGGIYYPYAMDYW
nr:immunoglobulin heavy chain junction region [Mus musculus]